MSGRRDPAGGRWPLAGDPRLLGAPRGIDPRRLYGPLSGLPVRPVRPQGPAVAQPVAPSPARRMAGGPTMSADPQPQPEPANPADEVPVDGDGPPPGDGPHDDGPVAPEDGGGVSILADTATLMAERDEYLSALQRLKADFDNYRKRIARQEVEQAARAAGDLVAKLLPVVDNLDLAWSHLGEGRPVDEVSEEAKALLSARQQLLDVLAREGLERVDAVGVEFDPTVHDAVAAAPNEDGAEADDNQSASSGGVVVDGVMRAGYRFGGRVIRPAMVRVRG